MHNPKYNKQHHNVLGTGFYWVPIAWRARTTFGSNFYHAQFQNAGPHRQTRDFGNFGISWPVEKTLVHSKLKNEFLLCCFPCMRERADFIQFSIHQSRAGTEPKRGIGSWLEAQWLHGFFCWPRQRKNRPMESYPNWYR